MKKIFCMVFVAALSLSLVACGGKNEKKDNGKDGNEPDKTITAEQMLSVYDFDIEDCVKLGDYSKPDIQLKESDYEVTDEKVMNYLNSALQEKSEYEKTDKTSASKGDIVNIDYTGYIDGKEFDNGADKGAHLKIGSNEFIKGFEDGIIGHAPGDKFTLDLKFPKDFWNADYQNKKVKFEVKLNYIEKEKKVTYDTVSNEFIKENFGSANKEEWFDDSKSSLESSMSSQRYSDAQEKLTDWLVSISDINIPESYIDDQFEETMRQIEIYAKDSMDGMSVDDYLKEYEGCDSEEQYREKIIDELQSNIKEQFVIDAIMKKEGTTITESGYNDFLAYYLESYGMEEDEFYKRYGSKEAIQLIYAENMVIGKMVDEIVGIDIQEDNSDRMPSDEEIEAAVKDAVGDDVEGLTIETE